VGILLFLGTLVVFAVGIGWGRAGAIPLFGHWPLRYCLFAVPVLCTAFYIGELYGSEGLRKTVQITLFVVMCLLVPLNTTPGLFGINWYHENDKQLEHDLRSGTAPFTLAERYNNLLFHSVSPSQLADYMRMLQSAGYGPFAQMAKDSAIREHMMLVAPTSEPHVDVQLFQSVADAPLLTEEIRYTLPAAGQVYLVWGLNDWLVAPEALRPTGTELRSSGPKKTHLMHTPMIRHNGTFITKLSVPAGATIDYGFLIMNTRGLFATANRIWDGGYRANPSQHSIIEIRPTISQRMAMTDLLYWLSKVFDNSFYFLAGIVTLLVSWLFTYIWLRWVEK
jgi:hypothetical protein